jgi:hypothetical protein
LNFESHKNVSFFTVEFLMKNIFLKKNTSIGNPEVREKRKKRKHHADIPTPFQLLVVFNALLKLFTGRD